MRSSQAVAARVVAEQEEQGADGPGEYEDHQELELKLQVLFALPEAHLSEKAPSKPAHVFLLGLGAADAEP